jgi:hypothetical protein
VFPQETAEVLTFPATKSDKAEASIRVLQVEPGVWISAGDYNHGQGSMQGSSSPLTKDNTFASRDEAVAHAADQIIRRQTAITTDLSSMVTPGQKKAAQRMMDWATDLIGGVNRARQSDVSGNNPGIKPANTPTTPPIKRGAESAPAKRSRAKRLEAVTDPGQLPHNTIIYDQQGRKYVVTSGRHGRVGAQPWPNGMRPNFSGEATVHFATDDSARARYPDDRHDLVLTLYEQYNGNDHDGLATASATDPWGQPEATLTSQVANLDADSLTDLMTSIKAEGAKPKAKRATKKTGSTPRKSAKAKAPKAATRTQAQENARKALKDAGVNLTSAGENALTGLTKLFGGPGKLNSGLSFDEQSYAKAKPHFQAMLADFQAAGKSLRDFVRAMMEIFGSATEPYLLRFAADLRSEQDANGARRDLERDSGQSDGESGVGATDAAGANGSGRSTGPAGQGAGGAGLQPESGAGLSATGNPAQGESGNLALYPDDEPAGPESGATGRGDGGGAADIGRGGLPADAGGAGTAHRAAALEAKRAAQQAAQSIPVVPGDRENIDATLPYLQDGQREDVHKAELRFAYRAARRC